MSRSFRAAAVLSLPLAAAGYYTWKIDALSDTLGKPGSVLLAPADLVWIAIGGVLLFGALYGVLSRCRPFSLTSHGDGSWPLWGAALGLVIVWLPFLAALYPSPGMNDTVYMMDNPLRAVIQFPWLPSAVYGHGSEFWAKAFGSREGFLCLLAVGQMALMGGALAFVCRLVGERFGARAGWGLWAYFAFFPMVGNYAIASVRDPLYSLALLGWTVVLWQGADGKQPGWMFLSVLFLVPPLMRSNGLLVVFCLGAAAAVMTKQYLRYGVLFVLCALIAVLPGKAILSHIGEVPLFQEAAAVPLQQMGRVLVTEGTMDEESRTLLDGLLPEEAWKNAYSPYTVDFVKWHDEFRRGTLNEEKQEFLRAWIRTGVENPRLYLEGWMTETYALWNLDPLEHQVQSRFGWALTDENTKAMKPSDNDAMAVGDLPMPARLKSALALWSFEGSRFLGAGMSLWITLFLAAVLYVERRSSYILMALPLWLNGATLLAATPASAVFRYSFGFVLILPLFVMVTVFGEKKERY